MTDNNDSNPVLEADSATQGIDPKLPTYKIEPAYLKPPGKDPDGLWVLTYTDSNKTHLLPIHDTPVNRHNNPKVKSLAEVDAGNAFNVFVPDSESMSFSVVGPPKYNSVGTKQAAEKNSPPTAWQRTTGGSLGDGCWRKFTTKSDKSGQYYDIDMTVTASPKDGSGDAVEFDPVFKIATKPRGGG